MEYTNEMFKEDLSISRWTFSRHFKKLLIYKDDLIQSSLIGLFRCRSNYDKNKSSYSTYAYRISFCSMLKFLQNEKKQTNNFCNYSLDYEFDEDNSLLDLIREDVDFDENYNYQFLLNVCNKVIDKCKSKLFKDVNRLFLKCYNCSKVAKELNISRQCVNQYVKKFRTLLKTELINENL